MPSLEANALVGGAPASMDSHASIAPVWELPARPQLVVHPVPVTKTAEISPRMAQEGLVSLVAVCAQRG